MDKTSSKYHDILDVAVRLIAENGFHNTPMALIAREANVGVGTIYRYFSSKEVLINDLYVHFKQRMNQHLLAGLDVAMSPEALFRLQWRNLASYYLDYPAVFKFIEQYDHSPFISAESRAISDELYSHIEAFFEQLKAAGLIKPLPYEVLLAIVHGTIVYLAKAHIYQDMTVSDALLTQAADACWDAIKL